MKTIIYNEEEKHISVQLKISESDIETAYEIVALARSLNPRGQYSSIEKVLEWAVFKGLQDFLPDMFLEMNDAGEITDDQMEALTDHYNASDWETKHDIINLNSAVL